MKILMLLALSMVLGVAIAAQTDPHDYSAWKNQPNERFDDAEGNFNKVRQLLLEQYYDSHLTREQLYQAATDGMLRALNGGDKEGWNKLITPTELKELQNDMKGEVTGIGVEIKFDSDTGITSITGLIPDSVAERGGIKAGDQIISINGKLYKGLQFRDVVYEIRGKVGEKVHLKLLRGDSIVTKEIVREKIKWDAVESARLENKVGLVSIRYFNENTATLLRDALSGLKADGIKALIVDLRGNAGGLFDKAVEAAGLFLAKGATVVRVDSRDGREELLKTDKDPIISHIPMAILTNEETSSGAELFAGSLVDNLGAKIVGARTHGKWNAQTIENLSNQFAVKFTTKLFKSPKNRSYQDIGMEPDISVATTKSNADRHFDAKNARKNLGNDAPLRAAFELLNSSDSLD